MSVIMTLQVTGDARGLERFAGENKGKMQSVLDAAKRHGLLAHRFYGSEDGRSVMVLDEWRDRQSFEAFFAEHGAEIAPMFEAAGVGETVEPRLWTELTTHDAYGWGA